MYEVNNNIDKLHEYQGENKGNKSKKEFLLAEDSLLTEETIIFNEGVEDDYLNAKENRINIYKEQKKIISKKDKPKANNILKKISQKINKNSKSQRNSHDKITRKKSQSSSQSEDSNSKNYNENFIIAEELFKNVIEKNYSKGLPSIELVTERNALSAKITDILYDKYVGNNIEKSKHLDMYSKIKDEEIRQEREGMRTKDDAKKINNMIVRQEDYEKFKSDNQRGRRREIKNKMNEEYGSLHNSKKKNLIRTPDDFYIDQKKFLKKKEEIITKLSQDIHDKESKNSSIILLSRRYPKSKSPKEIQDNFFKRLSEEKLRNIRGELVVSKLEKKLPRKEVKELTEKLYREREIFNINREKKKQEMFKELKNLEKNFVLEKSKKVLFDKFVSNYEKILLELFGKKDNIQINYDEFKNVLNSLGFIKSNINSPSEENLIKSAFTYLKPKEEKIDSDTLLILGLTILGIYKGNDEKTPEGVPKVILDKIKDVKSEENLKKKENSEKEELKISNYLNFNHIYNPTKRSHNKTSIELIKSCLPKLDLEKFGWNEKECKFVKTKFISFASGIKEFWAKDLLKKKQERQEKNNIEESKNKKLENKKKEKGIYDSYIKNILKNELLQENDVIKLTKIKPKKSLRIEDTYEIFQKKKKRELEELKAKQEKDISEQCTFQPNSKTKPVNKKEVAKNIEKLYIEGKNSYIKKKQKERDFDMDSDNEKNCTFKPVIKIYKGNYFENNPLKDDKSFNNEIKKMEKVRVEKGYTNKEIGKRMAFGIESKYNKEEIRKRVIPNKRENMNENSKNKVENYFDEQDNQSILKIQLKLGNNKTEFIEINKDEDFIKKVDAFCNKHELNDEKRNKIKRIIKEELKKLRN